MSEKEKIIERLKKIIIFSDFAEDYDRLHSVYEAMKPEKFSAKATIIKEGELGDKLYILHKGIVRILRRTLTGDDYTVVILNSNDNIFFGEIALIDSDKRSATVLAETECETFSINRAHFLELCENDTFMGYKITMQIAKRLSASLRKMNADVLTLFQALVDEVGGVL